MDEWLSAPGVYPEARLAIEALAPVVREAPSLAFEPIAMHAGDTLFVPGDLRGAAFIIVEGHIAVMEEGADQECTPPVRVFSPGRGSARSAWWPPGRIAARRERLRMLGSTG